MEDIKNKIEAVLFTLGKAIELEELAKLVGMGSVGYLKQTLEELKDEYDKKNGSLILIEENGKWKLSLRKEYLYLTEKFLDDAELDKPTQETLAIIAYKQPAMQSDIIKIRGNKAYDHIKNLKDNSFITSDKSGRTRILKLTTKFYDYFDVVEDTLKSKLDSIKTENEKQ